MDELSGRSAVQQESTEDLRSEQRLWPLLLIALAIGSVGYYLALSRPEPDIDHIGADGIEELPSVADEAIASEGAVRLRYGSGDARRLEFRLDQTDTTGSGEMITQIDIGLTEQRRATEDANIEFEREYDRVGVSIKEKGELIEPKITAQIESLLVGTREFSTVTPIGKALDFEWRSVTNPQVRQTLDILRHATRLLRPRMRRDAVNPGDQWSYSMPARGLSDRHIESLDGDIDLTVEYLGTVERDGRKLAVLDRTLKLEGTGRLELDEQPEPREVEFTSSGSGRVQFAVESGAIVKSSLSLSRRLDIQGPEGETHTRTGEIKLLVQEAKRD